MVDLKRLMDPATAVTKAEEAIRAQGGEADSRCVAELASAILIREGLVALAKVLAGREGGAE